MRFLGFDEDYEQEDLTFISEYKDHLCQGYNIGAHFFPLNEETHILTGSEDSQIYIYDLKTTQVA